MDSHFSMLGIPRGATEADMRKAYKAKALQYHPDRNPNGVEAFKKINAAYEELTKHYKKNGGVDKRSVLDEGNNIPRGFSGRNWKSTASYTTSSPLFTEEELFGRMPTDNFGVFGGGSGGTSTRQAYAAASSGKGFRQSRQPPPPTNSTQNETADEAWRTAHGGRKPESGYNAFKSEAESSAFQSQMKHFEEMERMKRAMGGGGGENGTSPQASHATEAHGGNRRTSDEGMSSSTNQPRFGRRSPQKMDAPNDTPQEDGPLSTASSQQSSTTSRPLPRQGSASSLFRAKKEQQKQNDTIPSYNASHNNIHTQRELEAEWASERDRQARLRRAQEAMEETERRLRREQREAETREEWERTQAEMELERTQKVAEERMSELNASSAGEPLHCVDEGIRQTALDRRKEKVDALSRLLPSKPLLDKMSIQEMYILRELVNEFQSNLFSSVESRIRSQTVCLVCHASKKDLRTKDKFKCDHCCICFTCSFTCALCPICGADRTDM